MKKIIYLLTFLMIMTACGQQKKYVSYTVKKGETMKSIAKDHGMRTKDLLRLNPDVSRKPEANTVIIVPNKKKLSSENKTSDSGKTHTVKRKETLYSIAKKYNVTVDELKRINNLTGNEISVGRIIKIPEEKKQEVILEEVVEVEEDLSNFIIHKVEKGDTVFNLTRRFNISEEDLIALNPQLKTDGLKLGMKLKVGEKIDEEPKKMFVDEISDKRLNIALMLPYKLNSTSDYDAQFKKKNSLLNIVTDFHSGVLMAVDSLRKQGMNVNLKVYDTQNSRSKIASIINTSDFSNTDAIIGPLFLKNAQFVSKELSENIPVIAPMYSKNQTAISSSHLVKVAPNKQLLEDKLTNYLLDNYDDENIIISGDDSSETTTDIAKLTAKLKSHNSIDKITIIRPEKGYIDREKFVKTIDTIQHKNWVILVGDDPLTANDVVNNLAVIPIEKAQIQLFSFDNNANFSSISNNKLERLNFTYPKSYFVDELDEKTKSFNKKYRSKYYCWPSQYAIKGFDVTYDALLRLSNYDSFNEGARAGISQRLGSKFDYKKKIFGSTENKGVFLIQFQKGLVLKNIE